MITETETRADIGRGFVKGMLVAVALTGVNLAIEHTAFGTRLGWYAYEEISGWLAPHESPVVIVDITDVPKTTRADGSQVTSREVLRELARGIAADGASAIGIDVDFAPDVGSPLHPEDARFFEDMIALLQGKAGTPPLAVAIGAHRSLADTRSARLGDARFESIAAHLLVQESRVPALPTWVVVEGASEPLWGLGPALVRARDGALPPEPRGWRWLRRANVHDHVEPEWLATSAMLVDTNSIEGLAKDRIRIGSPGAATGETLARKIAAALENERSAGRSVRGKIVLIGAADPADRRDNAFFVPGSARAFPGVYMHACAVQTILHGYLYRVTPLGRLIADLALALFVFGGIAAARLACAWLGRAPPREMLVFLSLLVVSVALSLAGGLFGVARLRLVWDGFVYVGLAAVLHLFLEAWLHARERSHTRARSLEARAAELAPAGANPSTAPDPP